MEVNETGWEQQQQLEERRQMEERKGVLIDKVMMSSTKKSLRVLLANKWYGAALDSGLADKAGRYITVEIITLDHGPWINKWAIANAAPQVPAVHGTAVSPPSPVGAASDDGWFEWAKQESQRIYIQEF